MMTFHFYENNSARTQHTHRKMFGKGIILNEILIVPVSPCLAMSDLCLFYPLCLSFFVVVVGEYALLLGEKKKKLKKTGGLVTSCHLN